MKLRKRVYPKTGTVTWFARWKDPDTGKLRDTNLRKLGLTNEEGRVAWAKRKSEVIKLRLQDLAAGAPRRRYIPLAETWALLHTGKMLRKREATISGYRRTWARFTNWLNSQGVQYIDEVDGPLLAMYQDHAATVPRKTAKRGGSRGERRPTGAPRAPATVNSELRETRTLLNRLRKKAFTPFLTKDLISDNLESVDGIAPKPDPLSAKKVRTLLLAALRHDIATFALTRDEHAKFPSATAVHETPRHQPVSPLVLFVLMTGARIGEALGARWEDIDLDAPDDFERPVGEIVLEPTATKTRIGRRIDLYVSPALRRALMAMKLRAGAAEFVFGDDEPPQRWRWDVARARLAKEYGAPQFTWQQIRQTTGSFLTNAPGIFRAASIYRSAAQLGHSPAIAMKHYLGVIRGIPQDATCLEDAMRVRDVTDQIVALVGGRSVDEETIEDLERRGPRSTGTA